MATEYKPLFQWFGGKSRVAGEVWRRFGDVDSYTEPFFGSGAMLFKRPDSHEWWDRREQVNDADGFVANFWRAVKQSPEEVARSADWPCNEADLTARHIWLVNRKHDLLNRLMADPEWCDPKAAGWWCWGQCWWIGGGWCSGDGPWNTDGSGVVKRSGPGVRRPRPYLGNDGQGVCRKRPHLGNDGRGVSRKRPYLGDDGRGVCDAYSEHIAGRVRMFADRLRRVRVCCGDWARVVTPSASSYRPSDRNRTVGVFLDPPYSAEADRTMGCYATESGTVAHDVRNWCLEAGKDKRLRIALCGYEGEHEALESAGWSAIAWQPTAGMSTTAKSATRGKANTKRERIWFSPACVPVESSQTTEAMLVA